MPPPPWGFGKCQVRETYELEQHLRMYKCFFTQVVNMSDLVSQWLYFFLSEIYLQHMYVQTSFIGIPLTLRCCCCCCRFLVSWLGPYIHDYAGSASCATTSRWSLRSWPHSYSEIELVRMQPDYWSGYANRIFFSLFWCIEYCVEYAAVYSSNRFSPPPSAKTQCIWVDETAVLVYITLQYIP